MSVHPPTPTPRWPAFTAAATALATDVVYVVLIWNEGREDLRWIGDPEIEEALYRTLPGPLTARVVFIASAIAVLGLAALAGVAVRDSRLGGFFAWAAAVGLLGLGILGAMSIGLLLLVAGAFALASAVVVTGRSSVGRRSVAAVSGSLGAVTSLAVGLWLTGAFR
jgi:lysylphosphatidylglycerol synthetase-like protein (DUF2156 family)